MSKAYQPKTGAKCHCKPGIERDNCPDCEGTGQRIDFAKIRAKAKEPAWIDRAIMATHNGQSQFGCILLSAFKRDTDDTLPRFGRQASLTSDGYVLCDFTRANGDYHMGAFVGSYDDLMQNCNGLATHLGLSPAERQELTVACKQWAGANHVRG